MSNILYLKFKKLRKEKSLLLKGYVLKEIS